MKANAYNTCVAPQAAYRSCSGAVLVTDVGCTAYRQTCDRRLTYERPTIRHPGLPFNDLHPRNPCNYMDYH